MEETEKPMWHSSNACSGSYPFSVSVFWCIKHKRLSTFQLISQLKTTTSFDKSKKDHILHLIHFNWAKMLPSKTGKGRWTSSYTTSFPRLSLTWKNILHWSYQTIKESNCNMFLNFFYGFIQSKRFIVYFCDIQNSRQWSLRMILMSDIQWWHLFLAASMLN